MAGMTSVEKQIDAALVRAFGKRRLPDTVDIAIGKAQADALEARHGLPIWHLKWARPFDTSLRTLLSTPPDVRSLVEVININLYLDQDAPYECMVIRGR